MFHRVSNMHLLITSAISSKPALREKCLYSEFFWSVFSRIQTENGEIRGISPYSVRIWENTDQKNSEYGHFSRSVDLISSEKISTFPQLISTNIITNFPIPGFFPCKRNLHCMPKFLLRAYLIWYHEYELCVFV